MKRFLFVILSFNLFLASATAETVWEPTGDTIQPADSIWRPLVLLLTRPELDTFGIELEDYTISKVDFTFVIHEGWFYPFKPLLIDGQPLSYGGFFVGEGTFWFKPPIRTERAQLQRFYKQDSIVEDVECAIIYGDQDLFGDMRESGNVVNASPGRKALKSLRDGFDVERNTTDFADGLQLLRWIIFPQAEPALEVKVIRKRLDQTIYQYEPIAREEVRLIRIHHTAVGQEQICGYYQFVDESLENINGEDREALDPFDYDITATIDLKGDVWADVLMKAEVLDPSCQFMFYALHNKAEIDGVELGDGTPVEWMRESRNALGSTTLGLLLPSEPYVGDTLTLRFRYHGEIAQQEMGLYYVNASEVWYPRTGPKDRAKFRMRFKSPGDYLLVASGDLIDSVRIGDTLVTEWMTDREESGVTFNIANYEMVTIDDPLLPTVELFYNRALHDVFIKDYNPNWAKDITPPIKNSLSLYTQLFGPAMRNLFHVTESLYSHGQSFPGQINLPYWTYSQKDIWGAELYMQAHEVAHQWWGSTVDFETYHDQWLSEGLAEYSAMRVAKVELKENYFYDKLREYRDNVFASRASLFTEGAEAGPIIQGYRTASSVTKGDYELIIYQKAALVLHMLRCHLTDWNMLDDSKFNEFMREYYRTFAGKQASTIEFKRLLEKQTGIDWTWFFDQWIYGNDLPTYKFLRTIKQDPNDQLWRASCRIEQLNVPDGFTVIMPLEIKFDKDSRKYMPYVIREPVMEFTLAFEEKPEDIRLNPFEAVLCKVEQ